MNVDFVIPVTKNDLLTRSTENQYVINEVLYVRQIPGAIKETSAALRTGGPLVILQHFDRLFSVLCVQKDLDLDVKVEAMLLLTKGATAFANSLSAILNEQHLAPETRVNYLNALKMWTYLLCQFINLFEAEDTKPSAALVTIGKGVRKGRKKRDDMEGMNWDEERDVAVRVLLKFVQLHIEKLWEPPIVEEAFVNLVSNCCYKLLENVAVTRSKDTKESICHLLGVLVKKYNHTQSASLKIVQLLQHFEHIVGPLVQAVSMFAAQYGCKNVTGQIMREIGQMDSEDLSRDASGTRAYSTFLVELAENIPEVMLSSISVLLCHLSQEPYGMRNGVLGVMGEILVRVLSKDNLDEKQKATREQFLDILEDHVHDVNAYVRSKVLQIWLHIVNEGCLPLTRQETIVNLIVGRLQDISSYVRKYAIQLVTVLLKCNPFAAKLSIEELSVSYDKEKAKLDELMPEVLEESQNDTLTEKLQNEWHAIEERLRTLLPEEGGEDADDQVMDDNNTPDSVLRSIYDHLVASRYREAGHLLSAALAAWPDHAMFQKDAEPEDEKEVDGESMDTEDSPTGSVFTEETLKHLKAIFTEYKLLSIMVDSHSTDDAGPSLDNGGTVVNEVTKQQVVVQYLKDSLMFASQIQRAVPLVCQLLGSKNTSDVLEAVQFFVAGFEFGVAGMLLGIRRMLVLIWSKEQGIKDAVVMAYKRLYLNPDGTNQRAKALSVVKNLSALAWNATLGDLTSMERLIVELVKAGDIEASVIQMLWERFTLKVPNTTPEESRVALMLLAMVAGAKEDIVKSNVDVLVTEGLGVRGERDHQLARDVCFVLMKLGVGAKLKGKVAQKPFRLPHDHEMFNRLGHILVSGISDVSTHHWIPLAEQAVNVIYKLAEFPDTVCGDILKLLAKEMMKAHQGDSLNVGNESDGSVNVISTAAEGSPEPVSPSESASPSQDSEASATCPSGTLARLLSFAGHVALKQLIHLDVGIFGELKRRHAIQENKKEMIPVSATPSASKSREPLGDGEAIEEELGLAGAAAEDAEAEYIRKVCEYETVTGSNLLASLRALLVSVCNNQVKYPDPDLRTAATLALAKFMLVSSEFCEAHLQLLFTILEKSPIPTIRGNIIVALGDLTLRFPNLIEPWTPNLYARLRDESSHVRKNTMQVLTHLILNDMVKVKGQISELATCIIDHDEQISSMARLFFLELSKKGNAVYNVIPDVISRLSDPDVGVDEEHFRVIMKYLFSFIQKDKHSESLVEKLCHRFRASRVDRQWHDLSFCLSLLSYSQKGLRKLQENFACFGDKLADDEVYGFFSTIIHNSKKFAKIEAKTLIEELEQRIEVCHNKGMEDDEASQKAGLSSGAASQRQKHRNKSGRTPGKTPGKQRKGCRNNQRILDSDDEIDGKNPPASARKTRVKKGKPKPSFSSDDESDLDLFDVDSAEGAENSPPESTSESEDSEPLSPRVSKNKKRTNGKVFKLAARKNNPLQSLSLNSP